MLSSLARSASEFRTGLAQAAQARNMSIGEHRRASALLRTRGGGGVLGISSDGDDRMEPKVKTQKNP